MLELNNLTDYNVDNLNLLRQITNSQTDRPVELTICYDEQMRDINEESRGIDKSTDVLSFPVSIDFEPNKASHIPLGSIVINIDKAYKKAQELSHATDDELCLLYIHGLLHILGFDHETDNGEMREEETRLIREYEMPDSLIVRVEG